MKYTTALAAGLVFALSLTSCSQQKENRKPNVLFIVVDDLRPELNCYGKSMVRSPNIDRLASEGILFRNAYCNIPVCGASRASLMTGLRPGLHRFTSYYTWAEREAPDAVTLPELFRKNGYYTISNSKVFHHSRDSEDSWDEIWMPPMRSGWRDYRLEENIALETDSDTRKRGAPWESAEGPDTIYADGKTALKAIDDLRRLSKMDRPFFLATGFLKPHLPFNAPAKYWEIYNPSDITLPGNDTLPAGLPRGVITNWGELRAYDGVPGEGPVSPEMARQLIHGYYSCVSYTDAQVGRVLDELEKLGLEGNTIVILLGDHGWNLDEHGLWCKHCNFDTSTRSTLILKVPGSQGGIQTASVVEFVDIYPSLAELCSLPLPENLEGRSFVSLLMHPEKRVKDFIIAKWGPGLTIKTPEYAYTEWSRGGSEIFGRMLYDHSTDRDEIYNLASDSAYSQLMDSLGALMHAGRGPGYLDPVPFESTLE